MATKFSNGFYAGIPIYGKTDAQPNFRGFDEDEKPRRSIDIFSRAIRRTASHQTLEARDMS